MNNIVREKPEGSLHSLNKMDDSTCNWLIKYSMSDDHRYAEAYNQYWLLLCLDVLSVVMMV